jgi:hypothetical protein
MVPKIHRSVDKSLSFDRLLSQLKLINDAKISNVRTRTDNIIMRFEVFAPLNAHIVVFWVITSCNLVGR